MQLLYIDKRQDVHIVLSMICQYYILQFPDDNRVNISVLLFFAIVFFILFNYVIGKTRKLKDLILKSDNRICADCGAPDPKWA